MRILGRADLERLLRPLDVIEALAAAFRDFAAGAVSLLGVGSAPSWSRSIPATGRSAIRPTSPPTSSLRRARVAGVLPAAGELVLAIAEGALGPEHVAAELAEVVSGRRPGRTAAEEMARLAYNRAMAEHVGTEIDLGYA